MASKTGGYDCKFVDAPPDKLRCQICHLVARTPHQVTCCGRVYCKDYLDEHKRLSNTCPNCKETGQNFPDIRGEQEVEALLVRCSSSGNSCGWKGELRSQDDHLTTCLYVPVRCTNKCTSNTKEVYVFRRNLDNHLKNTCPHRQYQCPQCKDIGRHCEITTTHLDTCPKLKVPCLNDECKVVVPRSDLLKHSTRCPFEEVPCKYAGIGCQERPSRKALERHENNDTFHLQLAMGTIAKQQKEIIILKEEQKAMKIDQEVIKEEQRSMKVEQRAMEDNIICALAGPCVIKMANFNMMQSRQCEWHSPPFYTHTGGYKMCVKVNANGIASGVGTHVSAFAYFMQGKNDDNLPWPFTGEVTFTLLNQLGDGDHYTKTVVYPEDMDSAANRRVRNGDRGKGYGLLKFIPHQQLNYDTEKQNHQYLKDDCLYFRIEVNAPKTVKPWLTLSCSM